MVVLIIETIIMDIHRKLEDTITLSFALHMESVILTSCSKDVRIKQSIEWKTSWYINHLLPRKQS